LDFVRNNVVDATSQKLCDEEVKAFTKQYFDYLYQISQRAAELILPKYNLNILQFETYPRVDVLARHSDNKEFKLELKFVGNIPEQKNNLNSAIRKTQGRIEYKQLDGLIVISLIRKYILDDKGFKRIIQYCLVSVFMSSEKLVKHKPEEISEEILSQMEQIREEDEEFVHMISGHLAEIDQKHNDFFERQEEFNKRQESVNKKQEEFNKRQEEFNKRQEEFNKRQEEFNKRQEEVNNVLLGSITEIKEMLSKLGSKENT
jgi:hypothetical protein